MNESISIISSAAVPVNTGDELYIQFRKTFSGNGTVQLRFLARSAAGDLIETLETITLAQAPTTNVFRYTLTDGELYTISLASTPPSPTYGALFASVFVKKPGPDSAANRLALTSGFITDHKALSYPLSTPETPEEITPSISTAVVDDPAAGAGFQYVIPTNTYGELVTAVFNFTAAAAVANRFISATITAPAPVSIPILGRTAITATQTRKIVFWPWQNLPADSTTAHYLPWPQGLQNTDYTVDVTAVGIQAADQFDTINVDQSICAFSG